MNASVESCLQAVIYPELEQACPSWAKPHTERMVAHVKKIIAAECDLELDEEVLEIAAYGYNWGYAEPSEQGLISRATLYTTKKEHARQGARKMSRFMYDRPEFSYLSDDRKYWVSQLIFTSDEAELLRHPEEFILMEASTLASLEVGGGEPVLAPAGPANLPAGAETHQMSRFITDYSKARYRQLSGRAAEAAASSVSPLG